MFKEHTSTFVSLSTISSLENGSAFLKPVSSSFNKSQYIAHSSQQYRLSKRTRSYHRYRKLEEPWSSLQKPKTPADVFRSKNDTMSYIVAPLLSYRQKPREIFIFGASFLEM